MPEKESAAHKGSQKELILKALTDPRFREDLAADAARVLGHAITPERQKEIALVLAAVRGIQAQIDHIADELFCAKLPPIPA